MSDATSPDGPASAHSDPDSAQPSASRATAPGKSGPWGSAEWEILERIARGDSTRELLSRIVGLVEEQAEHMMCNILLLNPNETTLRHGAAQRLPEELVHLIDGLHIGPEAGSCGAAAFLKESVFCTDIETHPFWQLYKLPFLQHGIHACWSSPIVAPAGHVLGTLAMYFREKRGPTDDERSWVDAAKHLAAIALTRAEAERENRRLVSELGERVKELTLLHRCARSLQADRRDPAEVLVELARMLPSGWQYPEMCEARIVWETFDVRTEGFRDTPWKQVAPIGDAQPNARIELVYTQAVPGQEREPFLPEEHALLGSVADLLAAYLERHRAERALQGTLSELRIVNQRLTIHASRMPLAYIVWDRDFTVTEWNQTAERIFGWTAEEAIGRRGYDLIVPSSGSVSGADPLRKEMTLGDQSGAGGTHENVRKDGRRLVCEWFHAPLRGEAGDVAGYVSMAHDVTERKRAEEERSKLEAQMRQAQRIQSLGTLAGGIAHDFNNILTAITGHTHLALIDLEEERSTKESLVAIQEASLRAVELVRRLLTFSRHHEPERKVGPLGPIIEDALSLLQATLPVPVLVESSFDDNTPLVNVDASQIQQVVLNLCSNAAYAVGENGSIEVAVDSVSASAEDLATLVGARFARYVRVTVSDNGTGMDEATVERIFEPFFTTKPTGHGTGLGLAVVHRIVKAHDGLISVHSRPGQGSTFRVYLPEANAQLQAFNATTGSLKAEAARGVRVLYVDDEEPLVVLATRWLGRLGHHVTGFTDSTLALEAFRARPLDFDAVISDFSMPGLSGPDLVRQILVIRPDIVVVMSSGYLRPEDHQLAKDIGATDVVSKPQSMAEFGRILHRILSERNEPPAHPGSLDPPATRR